MIEPQESTWGIGLNEKHYTIFDIEAPDYAKTSWVIRGISRE